MGKGWLWAIGLLCSVGCSGERLATESEQGIGGTGGVPETSGGSGQSAGSNNAGGGSGGSTTIGNPVALADRVFDVHAEVETTGDSPDFACSEFDLTGHIAEEDDGWVFHALAFERSAKTALEPAAEGYSANSEVTSDSLPDRTFVMDMPAGGCCERILLSQLTLSPADADGDGVMESFVAEGEGEGNEGDCFGDVAFFDPVRLTLTAVPDVTSPTLSVPQGVLHPLFPESILASEPLAASTTVTLEGPPTLELSKLNAWRFRIDPVMRFDGSWLPLALGSDLAGNLLPALGEIRSLADPGVLPQDGFETHVAATTESPINGSKSFLISGERITFHLQRNGGTVLRFNARNQWTDETFGIEDIVLFGTVEAHAGVVGGTEIGYVALDPPTVNGAEGALDVIQEIELPLLDQGDDVIVSFEVLWPPEEDCVFEQCAEAPALIDDLRIE